MFSQTRYMQKLGSSFDTTGLVSYWKLDANAYDSLGLNNATSSVINYVSGGIVDNRAEFNGVNSTINAPNNASLTFGDGVSDSPFSWSFWFWWDTEKNTFFINKRNSFNVEYQIIYLAGSLRIYCYNGSSSANFIYAQVAYTFSTGTPYHIVGTYNGSGSNTGFELYVNSVKQTVTRLSNGTYVAMNNTNTILGIGYATFNSSLQLDGYMDEVSLWDVELSQSRVTDIYSHNLAGLPLL